MRLYAILSVLALIPLLNWLVGTLVGIGLLQELFSKRKYGRIPGALILALLWFVCSLYWGAFVHGYIFLGVVGAVLLVVFTVVLISYVSLPIDGYMKQLDLANATGVGKFSKDCAFGNPNEGPVIFIDQNTRKIAIVWSDDYRIEPVEFITTWQLGWTETNSNLIPITNVYIKIETTSFDLPVIKVWMENKMIGEAWIQRLNIIRNSI